MPCDSLLLDSSQNPKPFAGSLNLFLIHIRILYCILLSPAIINDISLFSQSSSSYWEGKADAETLQRVYGISFPDNKQLKEWQRFQEEAAKRDHRRLGREQGLYFFHELSPGSCFFTPRGALIYNNLLDFMRVSEHEEHVSFIN